MTCLCANSSVTRCGHDCHFKTVQCSNSSQSFHKFHQESIFAKFKNAKMSDLDPFWNAISIILINFRALTQSNTRGPQFKKMYCRCHLCQMKIWLISSYQTIFWNDLTGKIEDNQFLSFWAKFERFEEQKSVFYILSSKVALQFSETN